MYPGCVFIKSASCDQALISSSSSAGSMVNTLISTIGPPLNCICSASVTFESSSINLGISISPLGCYLSFCRWRHLLPDSHQCPHQKLTRKELSTRRFLASFHESHHSFDRIAQSR